MTKERYLEDYKKRSDFIKSILRELELNLCKMPAMTRLQLISYMDEKGCEIFNLSRFILPFCHEKVEGEADD